MFAGPELVVTGVCWCRKVVAGSGLVNAGVCWCRKVVTGSVLVVAGAELAAAGTGKWTLVSAGAGRRSLVQNWLLLVQESGCWCLLMQER